MSRPQHQGAYAHDDTARTAPTPMKIVIADDHWMVRESLKHVMRRLQQRIEVLEAESFGEAASTLSRHPDVDLILVDLVMPGFDSFDGLRRLRKEFPTVPVVIVSVHEDVEHVMRSVEQGVIGYIPKSAGPAEVERALERVLAGEVSFPRRIIERSPAKDPAPANDTAPRAASSLTAREIEIFEALGQGHSVKRIAADYELSEQTVRVHLRNAMKKLNLPDRSAAIHYALHQFAGPRRDGG